MSSKKKSATPYHAKSSKRRQKLAIGDCRRSKGPQPFMALFVGSQWERSSTSGIRYTVRCGMSTLPNQNRSGASQSPNATRFIRESIAALRRKLLDITNRNPLISFKHGGRSRKFVRVVDELPDQLFDRLESASEMTFRSLGVEDSEPADEKHLNFTRALTAAKFDDPDYLKAAQDLGEDAGERAMEQLEVELRVRLRERLGMPPRRLTGSSSAADVARRKGIDPSFDLPITATAGSHSDSAVQTILFDDQMERTLSSLRDAVRLSVTESGVNPLFAVFGFLEWYEDGNSSIPLHAPLLLYPLEIDRELVRGHWRYTVRTTGESPTINVALLERLKRDFQITLPSFGDEDTPESYFLQVQSVIESHKNWKVRRWLTIGLYSFARIAMYHDLGEDNWVEHGGLEKHDRLGRLIGGGGNGAAANGSDSTYESMEIEIDAPLDEMDIPLIADADASQIKAVRDVLSGRDLVIEGPPGTGKSQTILNIIAAAFARGKTVLFLAEKMAALNVVRDRLAHANLDKFCLELHSTKAGKKETYAALARRRIPHRSGAVDAELEATLRNLGVAQKHLRECIEGLAKPAGKLGITIQELLWRCHQARRKTAGAPSAIDELMLEGTDNLTDVDLVRVTSTATQFEHVRTGILSQYGSLRAHPWFGVAHADMNPFQAEDAVRRMTRMAEASGGVARIIDEVHSLTGWHLETPHQLENLKKCVGIPLPTQDVDESLVAKMSDPQVLSYMLAFEKQAKQYADLVEQCVSVVGDGAQTDHVETRDLRALTSAWSSIDTLREATIADLPGLADKANREAAAWESVSHLLDQVTGQCGCNRPASVDEERALVAAVEVAAEATPAILAMRIRGVITAGSMGVLEASALQAHEMRLTRLALQGRFAIDGRLDPVALRTHSASIRAAPFIPYLNRAWWRAVTAFKGLCRTPLKAGRGEMAAILDDFATHLERVQVLNGNSQLSNLFGAAFQGIDSDFDTAIKTAKWADIVRARLATFDAYTTPLRSMMLEGSVEQIQGIAAMAKNPRFADLQWAIAAARPIAAQTEVARRRRDGLREVSVVAGRLGLKGTVRLSRCARIADDLEELWTLKTSLDEAPLASTVLGNEFAGHQTPLSRLTASIKFVQEVSRAGLPPAIEKWILQSQSSQRLHSLQPQARATTLAVSLFTNAISDLLKITPVSWQDWIGKPSAMEIPPQELADHASKCAADLQGLHSLVDDARLLRDAQTEGLGPLIELLTAAKASLTQLAQMCRRVIYQSLARTIIGQTPALAGFTGERHEAHRTQFRDLDRKLIRLRQAKIASDLARRPVNPGSNSGPRGEWTDLALIDNEAGKQTRHVSIRSLMDRAGSAVQQLMPCFMMSPLSIAQYLRPGKLKFDLVIMDEASQLRPEDAIGAIARSGQVVVVGDPKQLPPTSFFMGSDRLGDEDGPQTVADEQSILDSALAVLRPARRLKWHYRSQHGSLIAFSNKEFYESDLVVFPSPHHQHPDFGVRYVHVAEGLYRGRGANVPEAQRVAAEAVDYAMKHVGRSLGIVTLNQAQSELISMEIDRLAAERPEFEAWRKQQEQTLEPFFVKNLENVQGDERDVIFISTVFGRDEAGNFHQRFGPINNQGGHRRLNVLFTRAKCQLTVFSTMKHTDIRTDESSPWGVRALKGFLKFASEGSLDDATPMGRGPDSEFEISVAVVLTNAGYEVVPQVGVVGYFIDMAVRHPNRPGEFVLGIECDGATYHSTKSARDRDRLRQEILERLKWRIHRIWSLDWYRNHKRETERLLQAVRTAVAASES